MWLMWCVVMNYTKVPEENRGGLKSFGGLLLKYLLEFPLHDFNGLVSNLEGKAYLLNVSQISRCGHM